MPDKTRLVLFFTWDVSLGLWKQRGLLQREIKLYKALAEKGVDVTFLSWGGEEDKGVAEALLPEIKTISIYNHIPRPNNKALRCLVSLLAPWALRDVLRQADILKTNQIWGGWVVALSSVMFRKKLIARCGFELYDFTVRQGHGALRRAFVWLISRMTYGAADRICVATPEDKDFVIKTFGQINEKITIHPNWIDTDFFAPQECVKKENSILFVGRLSAQKNLFTLVDALQGTGMTLDIVGGGELQGDLEDRVKEKGVNVNFLGRLPNDELPLIYGSYPVFILPSYYEGNPKTLLEAMACGSAVIGTRVSGIASVIEHNKSGLLCSLDEDSVRESIVHLMGDESLRAQLGARAREQIIASQTLDKLLDKELACYEILKDKS